MESPIAVALIGALGSLVIVAATYWSTKQREREAEWRKEKLGYYKAFVESMSGIVGSEASSEGHRMFAKATNNLLLFAPQSVIEAVQAFRGEISLSNQPRRTQEAHDALLAVMLLAIRKDIGASSEDDPSRFKPVLWTSGVEKNDD